MKQFPAWRGQQYGPQQGHPACALINRWHAPTSISAGPDDFRRGPFDLVAPLMRSHRPLNGSTLNHLLWATENIELVRNVKESRQKNDRRNVNGPEMGVISLQV